MRIIIATLLLFVAIGSNGQKIAPFNLFTDRDIYVSGEVILFKVFTPEEEKSGIAKVSLINTSGKILLEVNKKILDHQTNGWMDIPDSLETGTYLLLTSTSPALTNATLTVKELLICNRFTGQSENTSVLRAKDSNFMPENQENIAIEGIQKSYGTRAKAHVNIHFTPELISRLKGNLFVSAVKLTPGFKSKTFVINASQPGNHLYSNGGVVLTGWAKNLATGVPFKNSCIYLSIPDTIPGLQYYITGEDGFFSFSLDNFYGKIPVVVQGIDPEKKRQVKIALNHRDSLSSGLASFENQTISVELKKQINGSIEEATLRKIFNYQEFSVDSSPTGKKQNYPFYGVPTEIVRPELFTDLPDFTEISRELLPGVKFRAYNRVPTLQILNPATLNFYDGQPLVVLDGIPVQDLNVIKNMGTKDISKIEICRKERFYGDLIFPGVVAIYSKNHDYQRLAESDDLLKRSFDALQPDFSLNVPSHLPDNEPDLRNILIWKPNLESAETVSIDFDTSDIRGSYQLIVRGTTANGSLFYKEQIFEVN